MLTLEEEVIILNKKRRIHDGIVGAIITAGVLLGYYGSPLWLLVPGLLGITLLQSGCTGFCPLYYTLERIGIAE
ncbi:MAG: DUF2892 domain-containing protein [Candidatus Binatia bacterium]